MSVTQGVYAGSQTSVVQAVLHVYRLVSSMPEFQLYQALEAASCCTAMSSDLCKAYAHCCASTGSLQGLMQPSFLMTTPHGNGSRIYLKYGRKPENLHSCRQWLHHSSTDLPCCLQQCSIPPTAMMLLQTGRTTFKISSPC